MITYNLTKPMSYDVFKALPEKTQKEYLTDLLVIYGGSNASIGEMFGIKGSGISVLRKKLGITVKNSTTRRNAKELEAWGKFIAQAGENLVEEIHIPELSQTAEECAEEPATPVLSFAPEFFTAQFQCTPAQFTAWMHENLKHNAGGAIYEFCITYRANK